MKRLVYIILITFCLAHSLQLQEVVAPQEGGEETGKPEGKPKEGNQPTAPPEQKGPPEGPPEQGPTVTPGEGPGETNIPPIANIPQDGTVIIVQTVELPKAFTDSLHEITNSISAGTLDEVPSKVTDVLEHVRALDGTSSLGLTASQQVDALVKVMQTIDTAAAQATKKAPEVNKASWGSWFWNATTSIVSTSVGLVAGGMDSDYVVPFFDTTAELQLTRESALNLLRNAMMDAVTGLSLPVTDEDYTNQQTLMKDYQSSIVSYQLDEELLQFVSAYEKNLENRQSVGTTLEFLTNQLTSLDKAASLSDQLSTVSTVYDMTRLLSKNASQLDADLQSKLHGIEDQVRIQVNGLIGQANARLEVLSKMSTVSDTFVTESQELVDRLSSPAVFEVMGAEKATVLREKAELFNGKVIEVQQRGQLETLLLQGNLKSFNPNTDTQLSYQERIQSTYQAIMDLYDETMYAKQADLLLKLIDNLKASSQLDGATRKYLLAEIADRYREIKTFITEKPSSGLSLNELDGKLNLKGKIPSDQMRALQGEILQNNYGIDPVKWPSQIKSEMIDVIESYQLFSENDQANNLHAFLQTPDLLPHELMALAAGSGIAQASDLASADKEAFYTTVFDGFKSLLDRALDSLEKSLGKTLTGLGLWFMNFGDGWRYKAVFESTAQLATTADNVTTRLNNFLSQDFIRINLPVSLMNYVETVQVTQATAQLAASTAQSVGQKTAWVEWLASSFASIGNAMVSRGEKLTGVGIDVNTIFAKAHDEETAITNDASTKTALGNFVKGFFGAMAALPATLAGPDNAALLAKSRTDFETARQKFRDFLGVTDVMSEEDFARAFTALVAKINYRSYADYKGYTLLKNKFRMLSRELEVALKNMASAYQRFATSSSAIVAALTDVAATPFDFQVSKAYNPVSAQDAVTAASTVVSAQEAIEALLVQTMRNAVGDVQNSVTQAFKATSVSPFSDTALQSYNRILPQLLLTRQKDISSEFTALRSTIVKQIDDFTKKVGVSA